MDGWMDGLQLSYIAYSVVNNLKSHLSLLQLDMSIFISPGPYKVQQYNYKLSEVYW